MAAATLTLVLVAALQASVDLRGVRAADLRVVATNESGGTVTAGLRRPVAEVHSPDRRRVARVQPTGMGVESRRGQLVITGPGRRRTVVGQVINYYGLAWSPDAGKVAYCEGTVLQVADADGRTRQTLHKGPGAMYPGACFDIEWSADGRTVSFTQVANAEQPDLSPPKRVAIALGAKE